MSSWLKTRHDRSWAFIAVLLVLAGQLLLTPGNSAAFEGPIFPITDRSFFLNTGGPGARALGFGGAFIALADDASCLEWNPAGMGNQQDLQVLLEFVNRETSVRGFEAINFDAADITASNALNFGLVHPFDWGNIGLAMFHSAYWRHEWVYQRKLTSEEGYYVGGFSFNNMRNKADLEIYNFDLAYSRDLDCRLSVGITTRFHQLLKNYSFSVLDSTGEDYLWIKQVNTRRYNVSWVIGALYRPFRFLSVGLVLKTPVSFPYTEYLGDGERRTDYVHIPLMVGCGAALDVFRFIKISADLNYISYSQMGKGSEVVEDHQNLTHDITLKTHPDDWEGHIGLQYLFPLVISNREIVMAARLGCFNRRPANAYYWQTSDQAPDYQQLFPDEYNTRHLTFGLSGRYQLYQVDLGYDTELRSGRYRALSITLKSFVSLSDMFNTLFTDDK